MAIAQCYFGVSGSIRKRPSLHLPSSSLRAQAVCCWLLQYNVETATTKADGRAQILFKIYLCLNRQMHS